MADRRVAVQSRRVGFSVDNGIHANADPPAHMKRLRHPGALINGLTGIRRIDPEPWVLGSVETRLLDYHP